MKNPFGDQQVPGSYFDLQKRILKQVQDEKVDDRILELLQMAYEKALTSANVVLSRPERQRMYTQISTTLLEHVIKRLNERSQGG